MLFEGKNGKGTGHPRTSREGPKVEYMYTYTLTLTSALYGAGGQLHAPAALPPRETQYLLYTASLDGRTENYVT